MNSLILYTKNHSVIIPIGYDVTYNDYNVSPFFMVEPLINKSMGLIVDYFKKFGVLTANKYYILHHNIIEFVFGEVQNGSISLLSQDKSDRIILSYRLGTVL